MTQLRVMGLAAGTVFCALGIGFAMQTLVPAAGPAPGRDPVVSTAAALPTDIVARNDTDLLDTPSLASDQDDVFAGCTVAAQASPAPNAMVQLKIDAPCFPNDRVAIHHTGLMFTAISDDAGQLQLEVPALRDRAVFIVSVAKGYGTVVSTDIPDLTNWTRVALQWGGAAGFQIHAREFGAAYGAPGHVWSGAPQHANSGSFLTPLGDATGTDPRLAEVYSFPNGTRNSGLVDLTVETEVTAEIWGRQVTAEALERRADGTLAGRDLTLSIPNCGAIGDFLVLNNLVDDLKIAAN